MKKAKIEYVGSPVNAWYLAIPEYKYGMWFTKLSDAIDLVYYGDNGMYYATYTEQGVLVTEVLKH